MYIKHVMTLIFISHFYCFFLKMAILYFYQTYCDLILPCFLNPFHPLTHLPFSTSPQCPFYSLFPPLPLSVLYRWSQLLSSNGVHSPVISRRWYFMAILLVCSILKLFYPFFCDIPWTTEWII